MISMEIVQSSVYVDGEKVYFEATPCIRKHEKISIGKDFGIPEREFQPCRPGEKAIRYVGLPRYIAEDEKLLDYLSERVMMLAKEIATRGKCPASCHYMNVSSTAEALFRAYAGGSYVKKATIWHVRESEKTFKMRVVRFYPEGAMMNMTKPRITPEYVEAHHVNKTIVLKERNKIIHVSGPYTCDERMYKIGGNVCYIGIEIHMIPEKYMDDAIKNLGKLTREIMLGRDITTSSN